MDRELEDGQVKGSRPLDLQRRKPDVQIVLYSNVVVLSTDGGLQIGDADDRQYLTSGCSNQSSTVRPCLVKAAMVDHHFVHAAQSR